MNNCELTLIFFYFNSMEFVSQSKNHRKKIYNRPLKDFILKANKINQCKPFLKSKV